MSLRFLIATIFILIVFAGGIMTGDGTSFLEGAMMIGGFIGAVLSLFLLNNAKFNKKLWKW